MVDILNVCIYIYYLFIYLCTHKKWLNKGYNNPNPNLKYETVYVHMYAYLLLRNID